jgi:recombinational DNA repair protein RecT
MGNYIQKRDDFAASIDAVGAFLKSNGRLLGAYNLEGLDESRFLREAALSLAGTYNIQAALRTSEGQQSLLGALRVAISNGLSLHPKDGLAFFEVRSGLVNYRTTIKAQKKKVLEHASALDIRATPIYAGDDFEIWTDDDGDHFKHRPAQIGRKEEELIGVVSVLRLNSGGRHVLFMTIDQILEHRDRYAGRKKDGGFIPLWTKHFLGAARKTVNAALLNSLDLSNDLELNEYTPELDTAVDRLLDKQLGTSAEDLTKKIDEAQTPAVTEPEPTPTPPEPEGEVVDAEWIDEGEGPI